MSKGWTYGYCSWCFKNRRHWLKEGNLLSRNIYECQNCNKRTLRCRYCGDMTRGGDAGDWDNECCAVHDGTIADFNSLEKRLSDLEDYSIILERTKWNLARVGKIAGGAVAGALVFAPLAYLAAPGIASALGASGLLGAASTSTAISSLSGAALTSASLAAIGSGGMAGGAIFISAAGIGLGGRQGAVISNNYFGAVEDFSISKEKKGSGPALIFINGFLSQQNQDSSDWVRGAKEKFPNNPYYYVNWESKSNYDIGSLIGKGVGEEVFKKFISELMKRGSKKFVEKLNPLSWAATISELLGNPWHTAMAKASMTGILLADIIARTDHNEGFILMGHSLGARVIYYLLNALSTKEHTNIQDVYLLGGAVDRTDKEGWKKAITAVNGNLFNCYSDNDNILRYLYQGANAFLSNPIGLGNIKLKDRKIRNVDVTNIVKGHMEYKEQLSRIFSIL